MTKLTADMSSASIVTEQYADVIAKAQSGEAMEMPPGEDLEIDPETYQYEGSTTPFEKAIKVKRRAPVRERVRSS
ncbi:hypothetical protein [Roseovarius sp.]|uniref:hypothetical protein n=1 Tax=Roseovarius sp. TaxID=1486281 RepID=UPI00356AF317